MALTDEEIESEAQAIARACWEDRKITDRQYNVWLLHRQGLTLRQIRTHTVEAYDAEGEKTVNLYTCHTSTLSRELKRALDVIKSALAQKYLADIHSDIPVARGHVLDLAQNEILEQSFWKCRNLEQKKQKDLTGCKKGIKIKVRS